MNKLSIIGFGGYVLTGLEAMMQQISCLFNKPVNLLRSNF